MEANVNLRVRHVCLCSVAMFNRRCYEQETQRTAKALTICREKKVRLFSRGVSKEPRYNLSLAEGSPSFLVCANCFSCQRPPEKLLLWNLFISFRIYFIFSCCYFLYFLFNPHTSKLLNRRLYFVEMSKYQFSMILLSKLNAF